MGQHLSQHPVDVLISDLIGSERAATVEEVMQIVGRLATAPFDPRVIPIPRAERGLSYLGILLGERAPSLDYHLVKRVVGPEDQQWAVGTTAEQYVDDLRRAVQSEHAWLALYERRGGALAAAIALTTDAVPEHRRGPRALPHTVVIYSADRGSIVTGYQANLDQIRVPEGARWFRRSDLAP